MGIKLSFSIFERLLQKVICLNCKDSVLLQADFCLLDIFAT